MNSIVTMKRFIRSAYKQNPNQALRNLNTALDNFKELSKQEQSTVNSAVKKAYEALKAKGVVVKKAVTKAKTAVKGTDLRSILKGFKAKVGLDKYREGTRGTDIARDMERPALKKGKRKVTTKGKTSNQFGTFKNKIGKVYYESRANRMDVNQPSKYRTPKLAKGGKVAYAKGGQINNLQDLFEKRSELHSQYANYENPQKLIKTINGFKELPSDYFRLLSRAEENWSKDDGKEYKELLKNKGYFTKGFEQIERYYLRLLNRAEENWSKDDGKEYKELVKAKSLFAEGGELKKKDNKLANGGSLDDARIYVADLAEYNNGRLVGKWLDLSDYSSGAEVMEEIQNILDEQTKKDKHGEVHEEYAIHDFEGFPRSFYSEYMGEADFDKLYEIMNVANSKDLPIDVLMEAMSDLGYDDEAEKVAEQYFAEVDGSMGNEWRDFAYEYVEMVGGMENISNADWYFDFKSYGKEIDDSYSDEELEEMGLEELDNQELGEQYADMMGGVKNLGEETIESHFDYEKFGRELKYDFISVRGEDGHYYFFNRNFAKGGQLKTAKNFRKIETIDYLGKDINAKEEKWKVLVTPDASLQKKKLQPVYFNVYAVDEKHAEAFAIYLYSKKFNVPQENLSIEIAQSYSSLNRFQIQNQYAGKTAEEIWTAMDYQQRKHFLKDHRVICEVTSDEIQELYGLTWDELNVSPMKNNVVQAFTEHIKEGQYAKGGMVVTKIADIPNFKEGLAERKITYRGLGDGKVAKDFYNSAGTGGFRIKLDGKEYYITDKEFDTFSRDKETGKLIVRFDAPHRKFEEGGTMQSKANLLIGKKVLLFAEGYPIPNEYEITEVTMTPPSYRYRDLFFKVKGNDFAERIKESDIVDFLNGEQVNIYNPQKGESYAWQLKKSGKMADGGQVTNEERQQAIKQNLKLKF